MGTITVTNLGKAYKQYRSRWSRLAEWLLPGSTRRHTLKWILEDLNFTVQPGEAVGIIGINGAGKSTLLKMITGTTQPTTGTVAVTGRVAALLELGMGFHPDFTGRQNLFMAGQLLGFTIDEISHLLPEIEAFSDIGGYIDQPVRVYSSGMQVRLAFSLATAVRPDVLIVDEALSVGDAHFQHKSFERIRKFRQAGTTLLLVSHDKGAIQSVCDRAILLDRGGIAMIGPPTTVSDYYNAMLAARANYSVRQDPTSSGQTRTISGTGEAKIARVALLDEREMPVEVVQVGQPLTLSVTVEVVSKIPELVVGYLIKDRLGQEVFGTNTHHLKRTLVSPPVGSTLTFSFIYPANFGEGTYSISVALHTTDSHLASNFEWRDLALVFTVTNPSKSRFIGVSWIPPELEIKNA